jgi:hypothetical protein
LSGTPPLNQLGQTMGVGVTQTPYNPFSNPDYVAWLNDQATEQRRQADQDYGLKKQQLDQQYAIAKMNAKSASERNALDKWYQQQQVQLAQDRLAMEDRQFNQTFGENQRQFNTTTGLNALNTLSQLRGPNNYFQSSNFARGFADLPGSAGFLDAVRNNVKLPGFVGPSGSPDAVTGNSLLARLGGGTATAGNGGASSNDALLGQIHAIGAAGGGKIGAGVLESLSTDELGLLQSGLEAPDSQGKAFSWPTFLEQVRQSRIGQSVGGGGYQAA